MKEFLDRVDLLSAKISTSAARYAGELAEKDALLEAQERRAEVYAGHAVNAQSMHRRHAPVDVVAGHCARPPAVQDARPAGRTSARELARTALWSPSPIPSPTTSPSSSSTTTRRRPRSNASMRWRAAQSDLIREIIVVDNGSTPEELAILRKRHAPGRLRPGRGRDQPVLRRGQQHRRGLRARRLHRLPQQRRLRAAGLDRGPELDHAERSHWSPRSGPMFLYPDGRVQEVGGVIVPDRRRRADRQGRRLGPGPLRHAVPRSTTARPPAS